MGKRNGPRPSTTYGFQCGACDLEDAFQVYAVHGDYTEWLDEGGTDARDVMCPRCKRSPTEEEAERWHTHAAENVAEDVGS